jgi:hypothetical protein
MYRMQAIDWAVSIRHEGGGWSTDLVRTFTRKQAYGRMYSKWGPDAKIRCVPLAEVEEDELHHFIDRSAEIIPAQPAIPGAYLDH